ncbi:unnamed protein product [Paramecium pentaurelia]|uniref:Uncharacterized protein n=1 Tax=Paramecium pentaurelia TaxID=43138 RepID=A0A8S1XNG2_9CILI|nr:unnamed protein product [Paramecium pentaurelia]
MLYYSQINKSDIIKQVSRNFGIVQNKIQIDKPMSHEQENIYNHLHKYCNSIIIGSFQSNNNQINAFYKQEYRMKQII